MVAVGMMEVAVNYVIDVITVWNRLVSAVWTVYVCFVVSFADMGRGAIIGVAFGNLDLMLFYFAVCFLVMQMAIM